MCLLSILIFPESSNAQNFGAGNLVVYRVGAGTVTLTSAATAVFLDEYTPLGAYVRSIAMPTVGVQFTPQTFALTASGTATSEGYLSRSNDKQYLVVPGYNAVVGTASVSTTASNSVLRSIGKLDYTGAVITRSGINDFANGGSPCSVTCFTLSGNPSQMYLSGSTGGVRWCPYGGLLSGNADPVATTPTNTRVVKIYDGQLYVSSQSGAIRIAKVGNGLPTTSGQTITNLPGAPTATGSPYGFFMADLDAGVAGVDVLYLSDETAGSGITKYSLVGGNWTSNGTVVTPVRGVTGVVNLGVVTLYATTTPATENSIISIVDLAGYNAPFVGVPVTIATAPARTVFRGIDFAPEVLVVVVPVTLSDFTVQKVLNSAKLSWSTEQEINSSLFIIERSADGRNWETLTTLNAAGNSSRRLDYFILDHTPFRGLNYYRIKTVDIDGKSAYSVVRAVSMTKDAAMIVSPNPAKDFISVNYLRTNNGPITVTLIDANGKTVIQTKTTESIIRLDLRNIGKGTYLVYVIDGDSVSSEKVLIQ